LNVDTRYLSSLQVAELLRVNVSTVKRWTETQKLDCIKTPGGHRKFSPSHIRDFVARNNNISLSADTVVMRDLQNISTDENCFEILHDQILNYSLSSNRNEIGKILFGLYFSNYPVYEIYDRLITPVLHHMGDRWEKGIQSVVETHVASQTIRDSIIKLREITCTSDGNSAKALLLNLETELHDIALKMVDHILAEMGIQVYYSGQITPQNKIDNYLEKFDIDMLFIGSTFIQNLKNSQKQVNDLIDLAAKFKLNVYVGGKGFDQIDYSRHSLATRLETFEQVSATQEEGY